MRSIRNLTRLLLPLLALLVVWGCTSSPTEPSGGGSSPITPKPPDPVVAYTVTVTANPAEITAGSNGSSNITVQVRRTDNGQPPPDLTNVTLTTNIGGFGTVGGPQSLELDLINGQAQAVLFAGTESGVATVRAAATLAPPRPPAPPTSASASRPPSSSPRSSPAWATRPAVRTWPSWAAASSSPCG